MGLIIRLCLTLCDPVDYSLSGSSVLGIFQARISEWIALSSCRGSSRPRDQTRVSCVSCTAEGLFTRWAIREARDSEMSVSPIFFLLLIFILCCTVFHLQCWVCFRCIAQWCSVLYIYMEPWSSGAKAQSALVMELSGMGISNKEGNILARVRCVHLFQREVKPLSLFHSLRSMATDCLGALCKICLWSKSTGVTVRTSWKQS